MIDMAPASMMSVRGSIWCFQRRNIQAAPLAWKSRTTNVYQLLNHTQMNGEDLHQTPWGGEEIGCVPFSLFDITEEAGDFELTNSCIRITNPVAAPFGGEESRGTMAMIGTMSSIRIGAYSELESRLPC